MATNSFEAKFGILADSLLRDKLPAAHKYALGFQVVASEDDNERALGVMAYQIGNYTVFVPIFWLGGKLKGGETMYLKEVDQWFPFSEVRLNYIETSKKFSAGELAPKESRKGSPDKVSTMELNWLHSKKAGEVQLFSPEDCQQMTALENMDAAVSLEDHLSLFSPKAANDLARLLVADAATANAIFTQYTPTEIGDILGSRLQEAIPPRKEAEDFEVTFVTDKEDARSSVLTVDEKKELVDDGIVVIDKRKDAPEAFIARKSTSRWVTPQENGIHMALGSDYEPAKIGVLLNVRDLRVGTKENYIGTLSDGRNSTLLIDAVNGKYVYTSADSLPLIDQTEEPDDTLDIGRKATEDAFRDIWSKNQDTARNDMMGHIIITDGTTSLRARLAKSPTGTLILKEGIFGSQEAAMVLTGRPGEITVSENSVYIPTTARVVVLTSKDEDYELTGKYRRTPPDNHTLASHGYQSVKVASDGRYWTFDSKNYVSNNDRYQDAVIALVSKFGLRSKQAKDILSETTNRKEPLTLYVKQAAEEVDMWGDDHTKTLETVSGPKLSRASAQKIQAAAQTDVKEILDTKILSEMAKSAYPVDKVKDSISTLVKALDRLCRNLFYFYWHNDEFTDQYGHSNMESLEDALKDNIQSLDDLIIYLQEKDTGPDDMLQGGDREGDLTDGMR